MPATDTNDGWIEWTGGACPVPTDTRVEVKFRDGWVSKAGNEYPAGQLKDCWIHEGTRRADVVAYRVIPA